MKMRGFTLIEIMITLVIVGILSAIAVPSYFEYIRRANRAEMKAVMMEASQYMQRLYTLHNAYDKDRNGKTLALPDSLKQSPRTGAARYRIRLTTQATHSFTLTATPVAGFKEPCGSFTLTNTGQRGLSPASDSKLQSCWK